MAGKQTALQIIFCVWWLTWLAGWRKPGMNGSETAMSGVDGWAFLFILPDEGLILRI